MITSIREVRRANGLSLQQVADRCQPPTTAQTIGRLETGTRTLSLGWLNRIAAALAVPPADLLVLPARGDLPLVARLTPDGAVAPTRADALPPPQPGEGQVAILVTASLGEYRAGDELWCDRLAPLAFPAALNRDVLVPRANGRLLFGRLLRADAAGVELLPLLPGTRRRMIEPPAWAALPVRLIRRL